MEILTLDEFRSRRREFDGSVMQTPGIPDFCSGSAWALAAHDTLRDAGHRSIAPLIVHESNHWLLFAQRPGANGMHFFEPFEGHWLFTCPLVGPDPEFSVDLLIRTVKRMKRSYPCCFLVGGVTVDESMQHALDGHASEYEIVQKAEGIPCMWISLRDGVDGYLAQRRPKFRKSIRQGWRRTLDAGVEFREMTARSGEIIDRLMGVEERSWKYQHNQSIFQESPFVEFYSHLIDSAHAGGNLRFLLAQLEGKDIGYILGSRFGQTYRGWQMSFDDRFQHLSIGNTLQIVNMQKRAAEGVATYDLGMYADYKVRWTDELRQLMVYILIFR